MKMLATLNLKTRAVLITTSILLLVLICNTLIIVSAATSRYREALIDRSTIFAEEIKKDIEKGLSEGLSLSSFYSVAGKLRELKIADKIISSILVLDTDGKVVMADDLSKLNAILTSNASKKALAANEPLVQRYTDNTGSYYEKVVPFFGQGKKKVGVLRIAFKEEAFDQHIGSLSRWFFIVNSIIFLIAVVLVYFFTKRWIARPIAEMGKNAGRMAAGDLSGGIEVTGQTEFFHLASAINALSANLKEMLHKIRVTGTGMNEAMKLVTSAVHKMGEGARVQQESTDQTATTVNELVASIKSVAEHAQEMSHATTNASSSATEMASSIEEVARNTVALVSAVEDTSSAIGQMIASIKQVSENTDTVASAADHTSTSITQMSASVKEVEQRAVDSARLAEKVSQDASERGMVAAAEAIKGMQNIKEAVEATAAVINRLGKRSQEIGQILKVIDEVTDQTGLLALNAAILAAQAGERGKGFAVVAEEIKDLAERTASSTQEISSLIIAVQEETAESVHAMGRGLRAVEAGASLVNVTNDVLQQVAGSSRQSADMVRAIEKTTAEQAKGAAQIMEAATSIASQIEQIANALQEQRTGSERIAQTAERMRAITRQLKTATQEQTAGGRQIASAVESITTQAAQVARATLEQSQGTQQISEAISRIQKITQDTVDVSIEVEMAVQAIKGKAAALQAELDGFKFS